MNEFLPPTLAVLCVLVTLGVLVRGRVASDLAMAGGIVLLLLAGVLEPKEAFAGLASPSIITIAALLVVSQGVIETGLVQWIGPALFGRGRSVAVAQLRVMAPVAALSAFINNTPLVAMSIPVVEDLSRRSRIAPGKLFIPLAFAGSLGGVCTLIGTSTNLVVNEMWVASGRESFRLFDLAPVGIPVAFVGILYLVIAGRWLLPDSGREPLASADPRSYSVEMQVTGAPIAGRTVEEASLRGLDGLYLTEIRRGDELIAPVEPSTRLAEGDVLVFIGDVRAVVSLQRMRGLGDATDQRSKLAHERFRRFLVEAVVSDSSPLLGRTIREARFRNTYDAVVIAVSRNGERLSNTKIGAITLRAGDVLLLETQESFLKAFGESRDFLLVRRIEDSAPIRHERAPIAALILAGVVLVAALEPFGYTMFHGALAGACLMIATRCCTGPQARKALNVRLLFVIAGSIALGAALAKTGVAAAIADGLLALSGGHALLTLAILWLATFLLTELLSNVTAAALMFPIAMGAAASAGLDPRAAALVTMVAASASFATPIGYQTNLMVQGPGGYRFTDYLRVGLPLGLLVGATAVVAIWLAMPVAPAAELP
ncbi:MAG: TRAP transporter large permease subunit [Phycisphaera sp.]|nr:TRAP transporter large permease subunit [Phycisphaera sp.]